MLIVSGPVGDVEHSRDGHPERPARIGAAMRGIADLHLGEDLRVLPAVPVEPEQLARVHAPAYLSELATFCSGGGGDLDPDTYAGRIESTHTRSSAGLSRNGIRMLTSGSPLMS